MLWDKKGPKTMRGIVNKALTGDGRKSPMKELERDLDRMLFGGSSTSKKTSKKKRSKKRK